MNNLQNILKATKDQLRSLSDKGRERVKKILEKEIEKINEKHKLKKGKKK